MQEKEAIEQVAKEVSTFVVESKVPVVENRDDYKRAGDIAKVATNKLKELEEKRLAMTRPLDDTKKQIMDEFKKLTAPIERFIAETKNAMLAFARAEQARQLEEERKERERLAAEERERARLAEEKRKQDEAEGIPDLGEPMYKKPEVTPPPVPAPKVTDIKTQRGSVAVATVKENWQFEIEDAKAVPRAYCEPSKDHIRQAIAAGVREIAGVKIYDAGTISLR